MYYMNVVFMCMYIYIYIRKEKKVCCVRHGAMGCHGFHMLDFSDSDVITGVVEGKTWFLPLTFATKNATSQMINGSVVNQ